ncbi:MAG: XRE family transcriptional regulator [Clostridiaceae bacterium]|nr:XRE family transcriptional regulator [Clostridiaceae bacterium]
MSGKATKAAGNIYYTARMKAAAYNERLSSREGAAEVLGIDRTRIARIELDTERPYPDEVRVMIDAYNAPELCNYHCSRQCPLGIQTTAPLPLDDMDRAMIRVNTAIRDIPDKLNAIEKIIDDGVIDNDEKPQMEELMNYMRGIVTRFQALELAYKRKMAGGEDDQWTK